MKKITEILRKKQGTTMVEMMVTLLLISIMMTMAVSFLSSASHIFMQVQKTQYAQSILDTVMTELRAITKNASSYIKIYENAKNIANSTGNCDGNTIEFINEEGYAVLVSTDGCDDTELYIGDNVIGTAKAVEEGQLLTRYYFVDGGTYTYEKDGKAAARAVAAVYGKGFYMGNYLKITYSWPDGAQEEGVTDHILATVTLYSDADYQDPIAEDSEVLEFRHKIACKTDITAIAQKD